MSDWFDKALKLYIPNEFGYKKIAKKLNIPLSTVKTRFHRYFKKNKEQETTIDRDLLLQFINKERTIKELTEKFKCNSEKVIGALKELKEEHHFNIIEFNNKFKLEKVVVDLSKNRFNFPWDGRTKNFIFGLCGDNQDNSRYTQITHLHTFYDICKYEGVPFVYHTGDIDEGEKMRPGHQYECYAQGADAHTDNIVKNYPKRDGIETLFITGNHDHSMIKHCGFDIGNAIQEKRPDMKYLGKSFARVNITPNCILELRHPIDQTAYAISYKTQKMIEAYFGGEKPNILAVGHYHKAEYIFYRNVHCIQTGCFQAQTPWMAGKGISAMVGGWIVEITVDDDGNIKKFTSTFFPFYKTIDDDWKNWYKIL